MWGGPPPHHPRAPPPPPPPPPPHEEVFTSIATELRSHRALPQIWYQLQTKFRDEPRPKSGLLRVREFVMKDSYSFDLDQ